jgi:hypothetical protein
MTTPKATPSYTIIDDSILSFEEEKKVPSPSLLKTNGSFQDVRNAIAELFEGFILTKTHHQNNYGIYKGLVSSLSGNDTKYIVAIIPNDSRYHVGTTSSLKSLPWISFQSRTTDDPEKEFGGFNLKSMPYTNSISRNSILFDKIKIGAELKAKHIYVPDHLPLTVEIILKNPEQTFAKEAVIVSAIQLFQTSIILDQQMP